MSVQIGREMLAREIVGEGGAAFSQLGELGAPLPMIWFSSCGTG